MDDAAEAVSTSKFRQPQRKLLGEMGDLYNNCFITFAIDWCFSSSQDSND
jgi:hypothetical protein